MHINASRNVDDFSVLARSTQTKPDAANCMDEGIGPTAIHLPPQAPNIDVNDVRHRIEMQVPDVLQQHCARNDLSGVAN